MKLRTVLAFLAILALSVACGGQSPAATATPAPGNTAAPTGAAATAPPLGGSGTAIAHVVVASGPLAGTYDATSIKYDCNTSASGSGATYLDLTVTEGLSSLTFASGEGGANPTKFYFQAMFGAVAADQPMLEIMTLVPEDARGSGTASLQDNNSTIKWTIDGTSADGIGVSATIECGPVDRR